MAETPRKARPPGRPRREDAPPPVEVRIQEALRLMRSGDLGITVAPVLAAKYGTGDREARDWVAAARKLLDAENAAHAKAWSAELVAAAADLYRDAKANGDRHATGGALDRLWKFTGNDVIRTVNENHNAHTDVPTTPQQMAQAVAELRGCTLEEAVAYLLAESAKGGT